MWRLRSPTSNKQNVQNMGATKFEQKHKCGEYGLPQVKQTQCAEYESHKPTKATCVEYESEKPKQKTNVQNVRPTSSSH